MKKVKFENKLRLNKETIARLNYSQMNDLIGGSQKTIEPIFTINLGGPVTVFHPTSTVFETRNCFHQTSTLQGGTIAYPTTTVETWGHMTKYHR